MTQRKVRKQVTRKAKETVLVKGNGNKRLNFTVISNDGGSRAGKSQLTYTLTITDPDHPDIEPMIYAFPAGKPGGLLTLVSDRDPPEPPRARKPGKGPYFKIVAEGGGEWVKRPRNKGGKQTVVINLGIISHNGSA